MFATVYEMFRSSLVALLATVIAAAGCRQAPPPKQYELQGQILALDPAPHEATSKHGDSKGFMPGMTMAFKAKDASLLNGKTAGDLVTATLEVGEVDVHLSTITKT